MTTTRFSVQLGVALGLAACVMLGVNAIALSPAAGAPPLDPAQTQKPMLTGVSSTFTDLGGGLLEITIHVLDPALDQAIFGLEIFFGEQDPPWGGAETGEGPPGWLPKIMPGGIGFHHRHRAAAYLPTCQDPSLHDPGLPGPLHPDPRHRQCGQQPGVHRQPAGGGANPDRNGLAFHVSDPDRHGFAHADAFADANTQPDTDAFANADTEPHADDFPNTDTQQNPDRLAHPNGHGFAHPNTQYDADCIQHADPNTHTNSDAYAHPDTYANSHAYTHPHPDPDAIRDRYI